MWAWWERSRKLVSVVIVAMVPLILLLGQQKYPKLKSILKAPFIQTAGFIEQGVLYCGSAISDSLYRYFYLVDRTSELLHLRQEVLKLHGLRAQVEYLRQENQNILDLYYQSQTQGITNPTLGRVVGRNEGPVARMIRINKGMIHGIKPESPVVAHEGAVGQVISVSQKFSDVLLITDVSFALDARIVESGTRGLVRGKVRSAGNKLEMTDIDGLASVNIGNTVVTSGVNSHFPPGIPIGMVVSVQKSEDGLFIAAEVKPFVLSGKLTHIVALSTYFENESSHVHASWPMASQK